MGKRESDTPKSYNDALSLFPAKHVSVHFNYPRADVYVPTQTQKDQIKQFKLLPFSSLLLWRNPDFLPCSTSSILELFICSGVWVTDGEATCQYMCVCVCDSERERDERNRIKKLISWFPLSRLTLNPSLSLQVIQKHARTEGQGSKPIHNHEAIKYCI